MLDLSRLELSSSIFFISIVLIASSASADIVNCSSVSNDAERVVCGSVALRKLDANLDQALKVDIANAELHATLLVELRKNLKNCGSKTSCLTSFYEASIFQNSHPKSYPRLNLNLKRCQENRIFNNCFGTYVWQSGQMYSGVWQENRRHGLGKQVYPNGDIVIGFWSRDELYGDVKIKFSSGKTYYGEIKHGRYVGPATIYDNGLRYTGFFTSDDQSQIFRGRQYFFDGTSFFNDFINLLEPLDADLAKEGDHIDASKSKNLTLSEAFVFLVLILTL